MIRNFLLNFLNFLTHLLASVASTTLTFSTNLSYAVSLRTSFLTTLLSLLNSTGVVFNLPICNLSASNFNASIPVVFFKSDVLA